MTYTFKYLIVGDKDWTQYNVASENALSAWEEVTDKISISALQSLYLETYPEKIKLMDIISEPRYSSIKKLISDRLLISYFMNHYNIVPNRLINELLNI